MFYLDTSAVAPLFAIDDHSEVMSAWLKLVHSELIVSDFAGAELAASISRRVRMSELTAEFGNVALGNFDLWRISGSRRRLTGPADIAACERLVRRFELKLLAPDALHIAMALADDATLVTFDERQAEAMRQLGDCVVPA